MEHSRYPVSYWCPPPMAAHTQEYLDTVAEGLENKEHTVTVELVQTHEDDKVPFYLVSIIGS